MLSQSIDIDNERETFYFNESAKRAELAHSEDPFETPATFQDKLKKILAVFLAYAAVVGQFLFDKLARATVVILVLISTVIPRTEGVCMQAARRIEASVGHSGKRVMG